MSNEQKPSPTAVEDNNDFKIADLHGQICELFKKDCNKLEHFISCKRRKLKDDESRLLHK